MNVVMQYKFRIAIIFQRRQRIPFDAFGEISAQASDSYTFTFFPYKIHMAISSFS